MTVTIRELYWSAGFLEGDGSFLFGTNKTPLVTATQVQRWPLGKLQRLYGGNIYFQKRDKNPNWSDFYRWNLTGEQAAGLMMTLYSVMTKKRQGQILTALGGWKAMPVSLKYQTYCKRGHEFTEENTYRYNGMRQCLQCRKIHDHNRRSK